MVDDDREGIAHELEGLHKRTFRDVVIDRVHLNDPGIRMFIDIGLIILVEPAIEIFAVLALFIVIFVLLFDFSGDLSSEIQRTEIHAGALERAVFDIGVDGLFGDVDLRMRLKDGVRGKALLDQRSDERTDLNEMRFRDIDAFAGGGKGLSVLCVGNGSIIAEMIETTGTDLGAAITGTGRMIPSATGEGDESRAGRPAMAAEPAMAVVGAFQRERELVRDVAMEIDLSADGRFVLTDGLGDSGPGRAVKDAGLDDLAFIESDVKMLIRRSHKRYLRSKRGIQVWTKIMIRAGRVNATCSSWRLNAISARLELRLLFHFSNENKSNLEGDFIKKSDIIDL
jgi:hypothetical protein